MKNSSYIFLFLFFLNAHTGLVPLKNVVRVARESFGAPVALEIENELLRRATFRQNQIFVDEAFAAGLLDRYFSTVGRQQPMRRQVPQSKQRVERLQEPYFQNAVSLALVMDEVKKMFGTQKQRISQIESRLLEYAHFDATGAIFVDKNTVDHVISQALSQEQQGLRVLELDVIPLSGSLRQLPVVQLNVNVQKANSCGFHALYNLKAIEDLISNNQPVTSKGVKDISQMYLDGYLAEMGMQESDIVDLAWEDRPAELARATGLKHFFLIQYFTRDPFKIMPSGPRFSYSGDRNEFYVEDWQIKQAERDFINSVQKNVLTACILGIPGHYTAFAVVHKPGQQPFIIYMNSISSDGVNSVAMQEDSNEARVATYLSSLIQDIY